MGLPDPAVTDLAAILGGAARELLVLAAGTAIALAVRTRLVRRTAAGRPRVPARPDLRRTGRPVRRSR